MNDSIRADYSRRVTETWGRRIARQRNKRGMTQSVLAKRVGVTQGAVSRWENGKQAPHRAYWQQIAFVLGVSADLLFEIPDPRDLTSGEAA